ncbi:MAG: hypothetical protein ABIT10_09385 [Alteraurantiacibacter sp.]
MAAVEVPAGSQLARYREQGAYTDCFVALVDRPVTLSQYLAAFYNSRAFRPERWVIGALLHRPAGSDEVAALAEGRTQAFSAWTVEARAKHEILLCDFKQRTRSWLMVVPMGNGTQLRFGSAVMPQASRLDRMIFAALTGVHRCYSRCLLRSAAASLAAELR